MRTTIALLTLALFAAQSHAGLVRLDVDSPGVADISLVYEEDTNPVTVVSYDAVLTNLNPMSVDGFRDTVLDSQIKNFNGFPEGSQDLFLQLNWDGGQMAFDSDSAEPDVWMLSNDPNRWPNETDEGTGLWNRLSDVSWSVTAVPEPTSVLLLAVGLLTLVGRTRRRNNHR